MSIPPLVCSTPPPPDQCDDDKEHDEFELQYNLSQEDDDEFCSYEVHNKINENQLKPDSTYLPTPDQAENIQNISECVKVCGNIITGSKTRIDEDNNIEDLDLKFEPVSKSNITEDISKTDITENNTNIESTDIENTLVTNQDEVFGSDLSNNLNESLSQKSIDETKVTNSNKFEAHTLISEGVIKATTTVDNEVSQDLDIVGFTVEDEDNFHPGKDDFNDFQFLPTEINLEDEVLGDHGFPQASGYPQSIVINENVESSSLHQELNSQLHVPQDIPEGDPKGLHTHQNKIVTDDDFHDFDAFQYTTDSTVIKENVIANDHNPWKNDEIVDDFDGFQATFDDTNQNEAVIIEEPKPDSPTSIKSPMLESLSSKEEQDDDFGDFDDFHSSQSVTTPEPFTRESNSFLNFKNVDNEGQIYESIEKVISTLYDKHVSENEEKYEKNLESCLCETWGHLTETEIRQPYMVSWNNSIGQKALLKALCIDSRNILFGPKWTNMPRYAANLSAAPLQPLKQASIPSTSASTSHGSDVEAAKSATLRPIETWTDTLGGEGQEFTYAEALLLDLEHLMATLDQMAHNQSSLKISELLSHACNDTGTTSNASTSRVLDNQQVPVYKEEITKQKIYSNTLTLQPLRQISLPDTHIFTPTDSEEPRSKTIHYDNTSIITQRISDNQNDIFDSDRNQKNTISAEMDDFQDFQDTRTSNMCVQKIDATKESKTDVTYQTQAILEPIKLEPTVPTLNWPEPGQVKETFDDFSDFVSSPSWSHFNAPVSHITNQSVTLDTLQNQTILSTSHKENVPCTLPETFKMQDSSQSVPALTKSQNILPVPIQKSPNIVNPDDEFDSFQFVPPESIQSKQETQAESKPNIFPINGLLAPMVPLKRSAAHTLKSTAQTLQPMSLDRPNNGSHDRLNSHQILQPLSLESFSQINWPSPGVDLQDLSRFNPINALHSLQSSQSAGNSKLASPAHSNKSQPADDDGWGDFVSIKPTSPNHPVKSTVDENDDWSDFVSSPSNGVNTISFNVHTNFASQKPIRSSETRVDIPTLNYITPKTSRTVRDSQFQNL